jgi:hypothetical protein
VDLPDDAVAPPVEPAVPVAEETGAPATEAAETRLAAPAPESEATGVEETPDAGAEPDAETGPAAKTDAAAPVRVVLARRSVPTPSEPSRDASVTAPPGTATAPEAVAPSPAPPPAPHHRRAPLRLVARAASAILRRDEPVRAGPPANPVPEAEAQSPPMLEAPPPAPTTAAPAPASTPAEPVRRSVPLRVVARAPSAVTNVVDSAPLARRTTAAALSAATGGRIMRESEQLSTVVFAPGPPIVEFPTAETVLARAADAATEAGEEPKAAEASQVRAAPAAAEHAPAGHGDLDEIYEHVVTRLRRDLLREREQMGDLLGDLY